MPVHKRLQTVIIEHLPWQECIARYDRPYHEKRVVMYLDPPYPGNNVNYEHNMRSMEQHRDLVAVLRNLQARFILTSYDLSQVHELFNHDGFYIETVEFAAGMPTNGNERSRNREIIVTNYPIDTVCRPVPDRLPPDVAEDGQKPNAQVIFSG